MLGLQPLHRVVQSVYGAFLRRLVAATRVLAFDDPRDPDTDIGPVICADAACKNRQFVAIGGGEGKLELVCEIPPELEERAGKPYIGPHVLSGTRPEHRLANEEVFGPVLSVLRARDYDEALCWAKAASFKLTGCMYSQKPSHLYLNRGITDALVGRQPFGGFGLAKRDVPQVLEGPASRARAKRLRGEPTGVCRELSRGLPPTPAIPGILNCLHAC